jgi:C1A family cysteine protease
MDNQQSEGDCTAEAWKNGYWQALVAQGLPGKLISRQYLYYYERLHMGPEYVFQDSGAALSDGAYVLTSRGVCVESLWPYWQQLNMSITPPFWCDFNAVKNKVTKAEQVPQTLAAIKHVIGVNGRTVQCGINVFSSLESAATLASGNVPMPAASETLLGGHAISLVGYDDSVEQILWKNSWGTGIGVNGTGYFTLPYEYILDSKLASDFWAIDQAQ